MDVMHIAAFNNTSSYATSLLWLIDRHVHYAHNICSYYWHLRLVPFIFRTLCHVHNCYHITVILLKISKGMTLMRGTKVPYGSILLTYFCWCCSILSCLTLTIMHKITVRPLPNQLWFYDITLGASLYDLRMNVTKQTLSLQIDP
jgi:hypothetical protein